MAYDALRLTPHARGVYFVMNPLRPEILARRANRAEPAASQELACDKDVRVRRWILVDCDPVRDPLVSATDAEKGLARQTADAVRVYLAEMNWPEPIVADSGNGFHLFYRRGLPADDGGDVRRTLTLLANRFDTPAVKVDRKVFNPSRIVKLPGTWARKGDDVPGRPHRRSRLLWVPGVGDVVPPATVPVNDAEVP
jgi:hypothetical protein